MITSYTLEDAAVRPALLLQRRQQLEADDGYVAAVARNSDGRDRTTRLQPMLATTLSSSIAKLHGGDEGLLRSRARRTCMVGCITVS